MPRLRPLALALALVLAGESAALAAECIDQELADKLAVKRKRRGRVPRNFVKAQRHELTALGGWYVGDLFSADWMWGGAYTFHMTEDAAVEASFMTTHHDAELARAIEDGRAQVVKDTRASISLAASTLVWYPLHGKARVGGSIVYFDLHLDVGVGAVDAPTSRGAMGVGGMGLKVHFGKAASLRLDVRDHVYRQELLDAEFVVNDVAVTLGLSMYLPWRF